MVLHCQELVFSKENQPLLAVSVVRAHAVILVAKDLHRFLFSTDHFSSLADHVTVELRENCK